MLVPYVSFDVVNSKDLDWELSNLQLYQIQLSEFESDVAELEMLLSPDENKRANRYRFKKDRNRFIICRSLLKKVLSRISQRPISEVVITIDRNKKPYLPNNPELFFNVSHTNDLAFIAMGTTPVGIDVEYIDSHFDYTNILANTLNKNELDFMAISKEPRDAFFTFWTRKEAFVKATGQGIGDNFKRLKASENSIEFFDPTKNRKTHYLILSFRPQKNYVTSVAVCERQKVNLPLQINKLGPNTLFW